MVKPYWRSSCQWTSKCTMNSCWFDLKKMGLVLVTVVYVDLQSLFFRSWVVWCSGYHIWNYYILVVHLNSGQNPELTSVLSKFKLGVAKPGWNIGWYSEEKYANPSVMKIIHIVILHEQFVTRTIKGFEVVLCLLVKLLEGNYQEWQHRFGSKVKRHAHPEENSCGHDGFQN